MAKLFELAGNYNTLYDMLTEADEYEEEVIETTLEVVVGEIAEKGDNYVAVCDKLDMEIEACKKQVEHWQRELKIRENAVSRLKDRLKMFLTMIGAKEIKTDNHTIKLVNNGGKLPLVYRVNDLCVDKKKLDLSTIPNKYKRTVVTEEIDTEQIRNDLDSGVNLDWVQYGERGTNLRIK